jgi:hypothetical protein
MLISISLDNRPLPPYSSRCRAAAMPMGIAITAVSPMTKMLPIRAV